MNAPVFDELTCPTCGGHIGSTGSDGQKPCTCFAEKPAPRRRAAAPIVHEPVPVDMKPLAPVRPEDEPSKFDVVAPAGAKLCRVCGKDLAGRTRMKDEKGYICKACSDAEYAAESEAERDAMECPECHRRLKPLAFVEYRGTLICKRCRADHESSDKLKIAKVELTRHDEADKRSVLIWAAIAGVLILIGVIATMLH